jgi:hypothetical protein
VHGMSPCFLGAPDKDVFIGYCSVERMCQARRSIKSYARMDAHVGQGMAGCWLEK